MDKVKLDVGAGDEPRGNDYQPIDKYFLSPGYICTDAWDLNMYADNSVDEIWSSHMLEHLPKRQVIPTLREWYRVLKVGGRLVIEVPDLVWCCQQWLQRRDDSWWRDLIFGNQDDAGQFHQTGFTHSILQMYVEDVGFHVLYVNTVYNHAQNCIHLEALK
jgi:predicted SAM-dependent methyltransferase